MNKEFKRFNNLPFRTQTDVCSYLLFNAIGSKDDNEIELMYIFMSEINPLVYTLCVNGYYEKIEVFGNDISKIENKVFQYLNFVASEINTL